MEAQTTAARAGSSRISQGLVSDIPSPLPAQIGHVVDVDRVESAEQGHGDDQRAAYRGAPAHERVIRTLRAWDIRLDESLFLGGMEKTEFLRAFGADVFFDDQAQHCERASEHVTAGHVPHGVVNRVD